MKSMRVLYSILVAAGTLLFATSAFAGGPEVFAAAKCSKCHSVYNLGIEGAKKPMVRDLSTVGVKRDAAWLTKFLKKEVGLPDKADATKEKMHKAAWKGTDADLTTLATWLGQQKTAPANPPAPSKDDEE